MKLSAWAPALVWMLAIFAGSTDLLSSQHTAGLLGPILHWLQPGLSESALQEIQFMLRKAGHLTEYAVLALLLRRALSGAPDLAPGWNGRTCAAALALSVAYALSDEFHQSFVPTRSASAVDVGIDTLGAVLGLCSGWIGAAIPWNRRSSA